MPLNDLNRYAPEVRADLEPRIQQARQEGISDDEIQSLIDRRIAKKQAFGDYPEQIYVPQTPVKPPQQTSFAQATPMRQEASINPTSMVFNPIQWVGDRAVDIGKAAIKPAVDYGKFVGEAGLQAARTVVDPNMSFANPLAKNQEFEIDRKRKKADELFAQSKQLTQSAAGLTDPTQKRQMLDEARRLSEQAAGITDVEMPQQESFLVDPNKIRDRGEIARTGAKATAGAASYVIPGGNSMRAALAGGFLAGGLAGYAASEREEGDKSLISGKELMDTAMGAVLGSAIRGGTFKVGQWLKGNAANKAMPSPLDEAANRKTSNAVAKTFDLSPDEVAASTPDDIMQKVYENKAKQIVQPSREAVNEFKSGFIVSRPLAKATRMDDYAQELIKHGVTGSIDDLSQRASAATGQSAPASIILKEAAKGAQVGNFSPVTQSMDDGLASLPISPSDKLDVSNSIKRLISPENANNYGNMPMNGTQAMEAVRRLEQMGAAHMRGSSTQLVASPTAVADQLKGEVYMKVARALEGQVDEAIANSNTNLAQYYSPQVVDYASKNVSPRYADQLTNALQKNDVRLLRSIQAPWINMDKWIEETLSNSQTVFNQFTKAIGQQTPGITQLPVMAAQKAIGAAVPAVTDTTAGATQRAAMMAGAQKLGSMGLPTPPPAIAQPLARALPPIGQFAPTIAAGVNAER